MVIKSFVAILGLSSIVPIAAFSATTEMTGARVEDPAVQAVAVEYYTRTYNLSLQEAAHRIEIQNRAVGIDTELQSVIGDYGGIWFDPQDGGRLKIGLVNDASQRQAVERIIDGHGLTQDADLIFVQHSQRELRQIKESIRSSIIESIATGRAKVSYSTATNRVMVNALNDLPVDERRKLEALRRNLDIHVQSVEAPSVQLQSYGVECGTLTADEGCRSLRGSVPLLAAGPTFGRCTAGFVAISEHESQGGPVIVDSYWLLTAGHCVGDAGFVWEAPTSTGQLQKINPLGVIKFFEGASGSDVAAIQIQPGAFWAKPAGSWIVVLPTLGISQYNERYPIYGQSTAVEGQVVCTTGISSDIRCGGVTAIGSSEHVNNGNISESLDDITETDICDGPGDSGGPVFMSNMAFGIVGGQNSKSSCLTVYQKIDISESLLGVALLLDLRPSPFK